MYIIGYLIKYIKKIKTHWFKTVTIFVVFIFQIYINNKLRVGFLESFRTLTFHELCIFVWRNYHITQFFLKLLQSNDSNVQNPLFNTIFQNCKKILYDIPPIPKLDSTHRKMHNNLEQSEFEVKVDNSKHNCFKH